MLPSDEEILLLPSPDESPGSRRRRSSVHTIRPTLHSLREEPRLTSLGSFREDSKRKGGVCYGSVDGDDEAFGEARLGQPEDLEGSSQADELGRRRSPLLNRHWDDVRAATSQFPAIILIVIFHLMVGVPFGVSYFPIGWRSASQSTIDASEQDQISNDGFVMDGPFPLPGKEELGIRMFLLSTIIGQLVFTWASGFDSCIALQMVENVPFFQTLAYIVVEEQGYVKEALSTLFFLFGASSILVGLVFYLLGNNGLGKILYFFPSHVLVGCIGGIGVFIAKTGLEVTSNSLFGVQMMEKFHLLIPPFSFEIVLRFLSHWAHKTGRRLPLLSPIYFLSITPVFYGLIASGLISYDQEYFFPKVIGDCSNEDDDCQSVSLWAVFTLLDFKTVSWNAVAQSVPTVIALILFSLIHVPINAPALSVSCNKEIDMNQELRAHGYSNVVSGICAGGLQNYLAYTQSVIYSSSGGGGKVSSLAVAFLTACLFFVGPKVVQFLPRCMAGTLLLHCGVDLFMEGVWESVGTYDYFEYTGIWLIVTIMAMFGIEAALIAGAVTALLTYVVQSVQHVKSVRGAMTGATLRSSSYNRSMDEFAILDSDVTGRIRIIVIQLQGHLFFGNVTGFTSEISRRILNSAQPLIAIIDFSLVLGIDSSAAKAIMKLQASLPSLGVKSSVFVPGTDQGFPCELPLSQELQGSSGCHVCNDLDEALIIAEDQLISFVNPRLLEDKVRDSVRRVGQDEIDLAVDLLRQKCPPHESRLLPRFVSYLKRQTYCRGDTIWKQNSVGEFACLLVSGALIARLENEAGTSEEVSVGSLIGESSLISGAHRQSTVVAMEDTVLYVLSRDSWLAIKKTDPEVAQVLYEITTRYLILRVSHVSNRIFETRCLPI